MLLFKWQPLKSRHSSIFEPPWQRLKTGWLCIFNCLVTSCGVFGFSGFRFAFGQKKREWKKKKDRDYFLRRSLSFKGEDTRLHPAKVRVKFIESQPPVAQVLACPSSTSSPSSPDVTLDFSDTMTSPVMTDGYARQVSNESGVDNPFRPDGELSREADTIVSLIKEGKPITPVKSEETFADGSAAVVANGHPVSNSTDGKTDSQTASPVKEAVITPTEASNLKSGANGSAPKEAVVEPGVVEVRHTVIAPPAEAPPVEQVVIKKKPKCKCCVIQ